MQESELMFKRKTFSYFLVVIIHFKEGIWETGTLFMISRYHLRKGITICFCDFILNAKGNSDCWNCIKISLIYIRPISPDFNQRISHKNALLILSNQLITLHEEHFKPIELWSYITEV